MKNKRFIKVKTDKKKKKSHTLERGLTRLRSLV